METEWLPMESNPDVFNDFMQRIGITGAQCVDVYGLDEEMIEFIPKPHLALILCYPEPDELELVMQSIYDDLAQKGASVPEDVFFMKQKIHNACGTFALLHAIAQNADKLSVGQGSFAKWFEEAKKVGVEERSALLAASEEISRAHEASAKSGETDANPEKVEHHFVSYSNINGTLYEFDSSQSFPRACGPTSQDTLLRDAGIVVQEMVEKFGNCSFSALALIADS